MYKADQKISFWKGYFYIILSLTLLSFMVGARFFIEEKITIYLIGDSTMANKSAAVYPETGWGQVFADFFTDEIVIENHARNGRSTKSFREQGLWNKVYEKLKPGDFVFIQFGHNDSKISDTTRYTEPNTTFRNNIKYFIESTRQKEAVPILLTPINRRKFDESRIFVDTHGDYPKVMRELAREENIDLIDLHKKTFEMLTRLGVEESKKIFLHVAPGVYPTYPDGKEDNTHFSFTGAKTIAGLVAESLIETKHPLSKYLRN